MILNRKQREALRELRDPKYTKFLFDGGIRSGKTELLFLWMVCRAIVYPGSIQIILRKEAAQHRRGMWGINNTVGKFLSRTFKANGMGSLYTLIETKMVVRFWNGSEIRFEGVGTPEEVGKVYGSEYITMWFNEAVDIPYSVVTGLWGRVAQKVYAESVVAAAKPQGFPLQANAQILFDTNPRGKRHWLYKAGCLQIDPVAGGRYEDAHEWCRVGGWKPWDNEDNINTKVIASQSGTDKARLLDGEWCDTEGAVYEEFNEDVHVCSDCNGSSCRHVFGKNGAVKASLIGRAIDFGWNDPTVCLWGGLCSGQLVIYRCFYETQKRSDLNAKKILSMQHNSEPIRWTVMDHQPEYAQQFKRAGVRGRNAKKDSPILGGIDRVKQRLAIKDGLPGLIVCQHCTEVIEEFSAYMMDTKVDAPEDDNNHCMDALRYMVAEIDGRRKSQAHIF
jgi:phage terminase large subunit